MDTTTATTNQAHRPLREGANATALPAATATALACHLLGQSEPTLSGYDLLEVAAVQLGDVLAVEAVYATADHEVRAVRFEVDAAGDWIDRGELEVIDFRQDVDTFDFRRTA